MTHDEISRKLNDELQSNAVLLHELQVHQIELEMQNRQLREAQQELEEARDRCADLYDFAPVGYLALDEFGTVLEINLTGAGMLGKERLNIVGQPFISSLTPSSTQPFLTHLRQIYAVPGNRIIEVQVKVKEGKPRIVSLESITKAAGGKRTCRTVMHDITDQRRMGVALQVIRSAQDALLNAIPALVFYLDSNLRYLNISQAFADFVGYSPENIAGKTVYDLFPRDVAEDFQHVCSSVLQTGMALYGFENAVPDASGNIVYLSTVLAPYRDFKGTAIGLVGVSIDISTIKSAANINSELLIQNRKLTRNLFVVQEEERRHLARELHDELGQWFVAIQAEAQAICNIAKNAPEIHDSALAISKSSAAAHGVIRTMLHHLRPSLLDELGLADSLRELKRQWSHGHPDIVCELHLDVDFAGLGEELNITVYRLVQESLSNVARHADAHRVDVSLQLEPGSHNDAGFLLLKVSDDGSGFDARQASSGIGLLGMRERVIAAGGDFFIDSMPGLGTDILARLPFTHIKRKQ
jgi:PAS domain S-box-containing protein